ncbi:Uncharacterised protein [Raoultella planticola]|uniref:Uncharacterized protein n=1 Tax=Raoultella planticola TaxID=575 RepID=A0A485ADC6_RAOPL|nr:Uncharacterised protein [Raoultella planticola]
MFILLSVSGNTLQYDRMTLTRVDRLTRRVRAGVEKSRGREKRELMPLRAEATFSPRASNDYSTSSMTQTLTLPPLQVKVAQPFVVGFHHLLTIAQKILPALIAIVGTQRQQLFSLIAVRQYNKRIPDLHRCRCG